MGVELPLRVVVTILECCVTFSGVKLSMRSFVLFEHPGIDTNSKTNYLLFQLLSSSVIEFLPMCFLMAYPIHEVCYRL